MPSVTLYQPQSAAGFEIVEHTADWALRVWGNDLEELFVTAAMGMSTLLVADLKSVPLVVERKLKLEAFDSETLLVDWLGELAYWAEDEQLVFRDFKLTISSGFRLNGTARGGVADELVKHIKAVTYHDLEIVQGAQGVEVTIVFDV